MGCCLSKKDPSLYNHPPAPIPQIEPNKPDNLVGRVENKNKVGATMEAKEQQHGLVPCGPISAGPSPGNGSCTGVTKEEVDAILIQCGRLSRSSSRNGTTTMSCENRSGKKGSSHDFDSDNVGGLEDPKMRSDGSHLDVEEDRRDDEDSRRRTPSRSRDSEQQRSANRNGSGRRASRSPGRRSENFSGVVNGGSASGNSRPGKMVSVPATVSALSNENGSANGSGRDATVNVSAKRIPVKRNVGEVGAPASPRSQSPARGNGVIKVVNERDNQQVPSLISSTSRKAEHSPHPRTPLDAIDMNSIAIQSLPNKAVVNNSLSKGQHKNKDRGEGVGVVKKHVNPASQSKCGETSSIKLASHGTHRRTRSKGGEGNEIAKIINSSLVSNILPVAVTQQSTQDKGKQPNSSAYDAALTPVIVCGADSLKLPQTLTRNRSSRRSCDLDKNDEGLLNANTTSNCNSLLLQDIQNFLQSSDSNTDANANTNTNINTNINSCTQFTLPPCVSEACSILEAVADLNSSTNSNLSAGAFADDKHKSALSNNPSNRGDNSNFCFSANPAGKKRLEEEARDSLVVESEVNAGDDLMAPSIHKYVTLRKKGIDDEEQESSGSNSLVGSQLNNWVPSCSWEPNSADSTDCFTSSRSNTRGKEVSRHLDVDKAKNNEEPHRKISKIRRESSNKQQNGTKNARSGGAGKGRLHGVANPVKTISAST